MVPVKPYTLPVLILFLFFVSEAFTQNGSKKYLAEIKQYQEELNASYRNSEESPLEPEELAAFAGLPFFPVNEKYRIKALFVRTPGSKPFKMATSTGRLPIYEKYGEAHFELDGQQLVIPIYQNHELRETEKYKDYLFLPFKDKTNGDTSYGGGRYVELRIPAGDTIVIDFNKAYNPYCAYNSRYSCPIPPKENRIPLAIPAGVKAPVYPHE